MDRKLDHEYNEMVVRSEYINACLANYKRELDSEINEMVDSNEVKTAFLAMLERAEAR
jgi:hypothetical protein